MRVQASPQLEEAPEQPVAPVLRFRWSVVFLAWTAAGLLSLVKSYFPRMFGGPAPSPLFVLATFVGVWAWAALTPIILRVARRFPVERGRWLRSLLPHTGVFLVFALGDAALTFLLRSFIHAGPVVRFRWVFWEQVFISFLCYAGVVVAAHAVDYHRRGSERRLRASQLETQLLRTRFEALEAQLRPHFLFNTLHSVAALVRTGQNAAALRMIDGLGNLLRAVLGREGAQEISLREELDFVERYLSIEHIRFQDRLQVSVDAAPEALAALVPSLVLQPLVENAIRHGVEVSEQACEIEVRALRAGDDLVLTVRDTGSGAAPDTSAARKARGIGLANTRARLEHLYGARCVLTTSRSPGGGTLARVVLPFHLAPSPASPEA